MHIIFTGGVDIDDLYETCYGQFHQILDKFLKSQFEISLKSLFVSERQCPKPLENKITRQ